MQEAVIVAAGRSPVGRANKGVLCHTRPDDMAAQIIQGVISKAYPLLVFFPIVHLEIKLKT